jgi:hypothetical protein
VQPLHDDDDHAAALVVESAVEGVDEPADFAIFVGGSLGRSVAPGGGLASADSSRYAVADIPEGTTIHARILSSSTIPLDDCSAIKSRQDVFEGAINVIG